MEYFHEKIVFRVAVNGSSGPATLALSSLLVGEEQREEIFYVKEKATKENGVKFHGNLLYDLQEKVRSKFMEEYRQILQREIESILDSDKNDTNYEDNQKQRYKTLVCYAVLIYLYNELYRYFLPLLSDKDMYSLYNGITNFLNYMRSENESSFNESVILFFLIRRSLINVIKY